MSQYPTNNSDKAFADFQQWKIIDLSLPVFKGMMQYPGDPEIDITGPYSVIPKGPVREFCYRLKINTQTGTHIQAPHYFIKNGCRISDYPVASFRFVAHIINLSDGHEIALEELAKLEQIYDMQKRAVIFKTGYCDSLIADAKQGENSKTQSGAFSLSGNGHPFVTMEMAQMLVRQSVGLVGIDSLGLEPPDSTKFEVNCLFCENEVFVLEGLCNLSEIPGNIFLLEAFPLNIVGVEGSPCRAVALVPSTENGINAQEV